LPLHITIGEIRLLQHEISSLTQRRKDFFSLRLFVGEMEAAGKSNSASHSYLVNIVLTAERAKTEGTKKSWRLSVFALSSWVNSITNRVGGS
jgi:hypothetical protein